MTVWFQDGATYSGADMGRYSALWTGDSNGAHLLPTTGDFSLFGDQIAREVDVNPGRALVYSNGGYEYAELTTASTVSVPDPSSLNPRIDLVVMRVDDVAGAVVEIVEGTPAASPVAPTRPARAVALGTVLVPQSTTTFTLTPVRYTGEYTDQLLSPAPGAYAVKWGGTLPDASGFREGATVYDLDTDQRWTRRVAVEWFTADPGVWQSVSLKPTIDVDGTLVSTSGELWARESSTLWEFSGQITLGQNIDFLTLARIANVPASVEYPSQNTYSPVGQSFGGTSTSGTVRMGFMSNGEIEIQSDGNVQNFYINAQMSKSPWNT